MIGGFIATTVGLALLIAALVTIGLPLAWLWMLIDALLREEWDYPGATPTSNNRLLWVLLILFVHFMAVPYFFIVYRAHRRQSAPAPAQAQALA
jgi:hypothetical protein